MLKTPARTLQANAFCERLIGTMRRECLGWLIPLHERHLRRILQEWFGHDNRGRPHTSLGPGLPEPSPDRGGQNRSGADSPHDIASWRRRFSAGCITNIDWSVRRDRQNAGVFCFCGALLISHPDLSHGTRYRVTTGVPVRHSLCVLSVKVACGLLLGSRFGSSLQPQGSVRPYGTFSRRETPMNTPDRYLTNRASWRPAGRSGAGAAKCCLTARIRTAAPPTRRRVGCGR